MNNARFYQADVLNGGLRLSGSTREIEGTIRYNEDTKNFEVFTGQNDIDGNVAASIGKKSFDDKKIVDNFNTLIQTIKKEKPNGIKGDFIVSSYITSTMGISYKLKVKA